MTALVSLTSDLTWQKFPGIKRSNEQAKQTNKKPAQNVRKYLFLHIFFCSSKLEFWVILRTYVYQFDVITEMPTII